MYTKKYTLKRVNTLNQPTVKTVDENQFSINYREKLNKAQFEAVSSVDGAYLIIAGAGAGKTRTLVYCVARLIKLGYDPKSILLLTFTRKAANEMMNRASVLLDKGLFPSSRSSDKLETLEVERRLMYVASTRAKQNLFIIYPKNIFDRESGKTLSKPSRFIADIKNDLVEGWLLEGDF